MRLLVPIPDIDASLFGAEIRLPASLRPYLRFAYVTADAAFCAAQNRARGFNEGGHNLQWAGAPAFSPGYASFDHLNFGETPFAETRHYAYFFVARCLDTMADAAHAGFLGGNFQSNASPKGHGAFLQTGLLIHHAGYASGAADTQHSQAITDPTHFRLYGFGAQEGIGTAVGDMTGGKPLSRFADTRLRAVRPADQTIRVGAARMTQYGMIDIALALGFGDDSDTAAGLGLQQEHDGRAAIAAWAAASSLQLTL